MKKATPIGVAFLVLVTGPKKKTSGGRLFSRDMFV